MIWGPRFGVDSWTNALEDFLREFGWETERSPRTFGDEEEERRITLKQAAAFRPHVFITNHAAWVGGPGVPTLEAYREAGLLTVSISHDEPYRWDGYDRRAALQAPGYDLWFTNWNEPSHLARHTARKVIYSPCAARSEFVPHAVPQDIEIGFVGVYYEPREPYLDAVSDLGLRAWLIPRTEPPFHQWPPPPRIAACVPPQTVYMTPHALADINRRSKIALDISEQPDGRVRCPKNRLFECLASGSFVLVGRCQQIEAMFRDGEHLVCYDDAEDLREKALYYLARPDERARIAAAGCAEAHALHTWQHRAMQISGEMDALIEKTGPAGRWPVGVVIPTKDRPGLLARAVLSAAGVPVVVVNTGSTPAKIPDGLCTVIERPGAGPSEARNAGVQALPPEVRWVKFLDDDDYLRAGWRQALFPLSTEASAIIGAALSKDPRAPGHIPPERPYTSMIAVRRDTFESVGGFNPAVAIAEERDLLDRLRRAGFPVVSIPFIVCGKGGEDPRPRVVAPDPARRLEPANPRWRRFQSAAPGSRVN